MSSQPDYEPRDAQPDVSGWAAGGLIFAATIMGLVGVFQVISGLVAIIDDEFFVVTRNYTFDLDTSAWGWLHLIIGALCLFTSFGLFSQSVWAAGFTVAVAALAAVANFFFIPYYPIWALVVIGLSVWVIWAVTRPGVIRD